MHHHHSLWPAWGGNGHTYMYMLSSAPYYTGTSFLHSRMRHTVLVMHTLTRWPAAVLRPVVVSSMTWYPAEWNSNSNRLQNTLSMSFFNSSGSFSCMAVSSSALIALQNHTSPARTHQYSIQQRPTALRYIIRETVKLIEQHIG